jgi:hypothetical protein
MNYSLAPSISWAGREITSDRESPGATLCHWERTGPGADLPGDPRPLFVEADEDEGKEAEEECCPGQKPPFVAVRHPARPYKRAARNRSTVENAKDA